MRGLGRDEDGMSEPPSVRLSSDPRLHLLRLDAQRQKPRLPDPKLANTSLSRRELSTPAARAGVCPTELLIGLRQPASPEPTPEADWATPTSALRATQHLKHPKLSRKLFANPHEHA